MIVAPDNSPARPSRARPAWLLLSLVVLAGLAVLAWRLLSAQQPPAPGAQLLGAWKELRHGSTIEFRDDGQVYINQQPTYTYELLGERQLKMTMLSAADHHDEPAGEQQEDEEGHAEEQPVVVEAEFTIVDDLLTITPLGGRADQFRRLDAEGTE